MEIEKRIASLIRRTSSSLSKDVLDALKAASLREAKGSSAYSEDPRRTAVSLRPVDGVKHALPHPLKISSGADRCIRHSRSSSMSDCAAK